MKTCRTRMMLKTLPALVLIGACNPGGVELPNDDGQATETVGTTGTGNTPKGDEQGTETVDETGSGGEQGGSDETDNPSTGGADEDGSGKGITAKQAIAAMGLGFNLGQMFDNTQHPRTVEAARAKIDAYYAKGFRTVRIPITWTEPVGGDLLVNDPLVGDVNRAHPRLAVIEQVVDYALSQPIMYVVINAHHEHALKDKNRAAVLERLWLDIAEIFSERDYRLIFEILNEPHREDTDFSAMSPKDVRAMTALAYAKIRGVDAKRILVIGGNRWFAADEMAKVWPNLDDVGKGQDPYVMATYHQYNPWTFCGDNQGDYADPWTDADIAGPMKTMQQWASTVGGGMPFYIGEWGVGWQSVLPTMDCNNIRAYYAKFDAQFAQAKGIPTMVWDDGGWFGIFSHATNGYQNNLVECILGTCEWNGTERFNAACVPEP